MTKVLTGSYKLKDKLTVRFANSVMSMPKGTSMDVTQHDKTNRKVLIDFHDGYIDWFHESWIKMYAERS